MMTSTALTGRIGESLFPELARQVYAHSLTGALTLARGVGAARAEKVIYFEQGEIYAAASSLAEDSVLAILIKAQRLSRSDAERIQIELMAGRSFGEALVAAGCVEREGLENLRVEHVRRIIYSLCQWTEGESDFAEQRRIPGGPLAVTTRTLIFEGARQGTVSAAFRRTAPASLIVASGWDAGDSAALRLSPDETRLLSLLTTPLTFAEIMTSRDLTEEDLLRALYPLEAVGLIECQAESRDEPVRAQAAVFDEAACAEAAAPPELPAPVVVEPTGSVQAESAAAARIPSVEEQAFALLVESEAVSEAVPAGFDAADLHEALAEIIAQWAAEPQASEQQVRLRELKEAIQAFSARVSAAHDDYDLLGLRPGALPTEVKQAYRRLVGQYHPDRHQQYADAGTLTQLTEIIAAARKAYETALEHALLSEVLTVSTKRQQPAEGVRPGPTRGTTEGDSADRAAAKEQAAEAKFGEAIACERRGKIDEAIKLLGEAIRLAPENARYHVELATLMQRSPRHRKIVETHLLRAVELEPENVVHHLQLSAFYRNLGFLTRAEQQLRIALKINPQSRPALAALQELVALKQAKLATTINARTRRPDSPGLLSRLFRSRSR